MKKLIPFILLLLLTTGCATSQLHERVALLEYREVMVQEELKRINKISALHTQTLGILIEEIQKKLNTSL